MAQEDVAAAAAANGATTAVEKSVTFTAYKPQLIVEAQKVGDAVAFYKAVFGAVETGRSLYPKRKADQELPHLVSSELELAGTTVVVSDVSVNSGSDAKTGTMPAILETDDVEAAVAKAVAAGAVKVEEEEEDVSEVGVKGKVTDPFGFTWIFVAPAKKSEKEGNKEGVAAELRWAWACCTITRVYGTLRPSTANGPPTPVLSVRGSHPVPTVGPLIFQSSESLFIDHAITTRSFSMLWPHLYGIANHFPIGYPSFHYSSPNTLNSGVLNGCMMKKEPKPLASNRARSEGVEVPEIAEQLRRSRSRLTIKKGEET
uniref:Uncharacterized protein n=1 Tax=Brassica oleracea var. oleracea TaxID=109376 RepID=A0A0D3E0U6_BRAOL